MKKYSILFVCMGNICRSPMAEAIMNLLVEQAGLGDLFFIDSAGTISAHRGELPDRRMREHGKARGYELTHRSRPVVATDLERFDMLIGMDDHNMDVLRGMAQTPEEMMKIKRMADFFITQTIDHVPDPYYGGASGFTFVIDLLEEACAELLRQSREQEGI